MGTTAIFHPLIQRPLRIAHLTDLHVLPDRLDGYSPEFADFIRWQSGELSNPTAGGAAACAGVAAARPDLVLVGGDIVDFIDDRAIDAATALVDGIGAPTYYCVGNHERPWSVTMTDNESESKPGRNGRRTYPQDEGQDGQEQQQFCLSQQPIEEVAPRFGLSVNRSTAHVEYAIVHDGTRIIVLDSSRGELTAEQADWIEAQVEQDDLPFLILTHVPFPILTLIPRIRILARDQMLGHILDNATCDRVMELTGRPNFLGALTGHIHARSEDVLGGACQLLTQPAAFGGYRIIDLLPVCTPKVFTSTAIRLHQRPRALRMTHKG
jgi:predicted MPP superfamily phosphohydrolase